LPRVSPRLLWLKLHLLAYVLLLLSLPSTIQGSAAAEVLRIVIYVDKSHTDVGEHIMVSGRVTDTKDQGVAGAEISIQVDGPKGGTVHIAFLYTNISGGFSDSFLLTKGITAGDYTIHVTAGSHEYQAYKRFSFRIETGTESPIPREYYLALFGLITVPVIGSLLIHRRRRRRMLELLEPSEDMDYIAVARASARLEKLKVQKRIDEETYHRLRHEYERRLKGLSKNP